MKQKIYYSLYDAECAAMAFVQDHPGSSIRMTSFGSYDYDFIDDKADAEEDARFTENVGLWSGEATAIVVEDEAGQILGKFGWWDDEID